MNRQIKFRVWNGYTINHGGIAINNSTGELEVFKGDKVMQFTGLLDKNGKEIYEGDLIECYDTAGEKVYTYPHEVKLPDFYREIWSENDYNLPADLGDWTKVLVVGNLYENPELIKNN